MEEKREPLGRRRPIIVTIFCALGFIGFPFYAERMTDLTERKLVIDTFGELHLRIEIILQVFFLIAYIGCWFLKKWGAYLMVTLTLVAGIFYAMAEPKLLVQWARFIFISLVMVTCLKHMD